MAFSHPFSSNMSWIYANGRSAVNAPFQCPSPSSVRNQLPPTLPPDPRIWGREHVTIFLRWVEQEFVVSPHDLEKFKLNGKGLCILTRTNLSERAPVSGDIIFNCLQLLKRDADNLQLSVPLSPLTPSLWSPYALPLHSHPPTRSWIVSPNLGVNFMSTASGPTSPAEDSANYVRNRRQNSYENMAHASGTQSYPISDPAYREQFTGTPTTPATEQVFFPDEVSKDNGHRDGVVLFDFLLKLLNDPAEKYASLITWKNRETNVFCFTDPEGLARLWGHQKNLQCMTYAKMARALRYYYPRNILRKVRGELFCYQFSKNVTELNYMNTGIFRRRSMAYRQYLECSQKYQTASLPQPSEEPHTSANAIELQQPPLRRIDTSSSSILQKQDPPTSQLQQLQIKIEPEDSDTEDYHL